MKKTLLTVCAVIMALVSCNKEEALFEPKLSVEPVDVVFNLSATHPDGNATKAVKTSWETDDVIFVFFSGQTAPAYLELKWNGAEWVDTRRNLSFAESETGTMTAIFLPFGSDAVVSADGEGNYTFDEIYLSYYLTAQLPYIVSGGEINGNFSMRIPDGYIQFFIDDSYADDAPGELREPHLTPQGITSIAADGTITHTNIAHGAPLPSYVYDKEDKLSGEQKGRLFSGILAAEARNVETDYNFTLVIDGWQGNYYSMSFAGKTFYRGPQEGRALKLPSVTGWTAITDYKPIDLGCDIPNGVGEEKKRIYWASRNVGATADVPENTSDEERRKTFGNFFAWGETTKKTNYYWDTYAYAKGNNNRFTKYCTDVDYGDGGFTDLLTELEMSDDAARYNCGRIWRMPTLAEYQALKKDHSWAWDDTKVGWVVSVSGGTAWSDPTIFLPAAGHYAGSSHSNWHDYNMHCGYYWSSTLSSTKYASYLLFSKTTYSAVNVGADLTRAYGTPIRAVTE